MYKLSLDTVVYDKESDKDMTIDEWSRHILSALVKNAVYNGLDFMPTEASSRVVDAVNDRVLELLNIALRSK